MASRRDELNAYTFARKRMVGAFLQPGGGGNDEDAPRPIRAVLPSFVIGAVIVAGFAMWGVIKPAAPPNWDNGKFIIQGKSSTTRYVILPDSKTNQPTLHQVLNMSSARLVLPEGATVQTVADDVLDKYPRRGATIGIPYAPDKLPKADDAGNAKVWSVCDKMGKDNLQSTVAQSVFIAAGQDIKTLALPEKLVGNGASLFVQEPPNAGDPGTMFLIDGNGKKHAVGRADTPADERTALVRALFGPDAKPQQVTAEWLRTLEYGEPVVFPRIDSLKTTGQSGTSQLELSQPAQRKVGRLLTFQGAYYAVGAQKLYQVTRFQAELMRLDPRTQAAYGADNPEIADVGASDISKLQTKTVKDLMDDAKDLPTQPSPAVNLNGDKPGRTVICSTFNGMDNGQIKRSVWASTEYPAEVTAGSVSAHVTPGHGLLYRAVDGDAVGADGQAGSGSDFLITDAGLRYSLPANDDGAAGGASPAPNAQGGDNKNAAQARLGYKNVNPPLVPAAWSKLVPAGPVLNTNTALQAQNA
ncbi:type VII secretion protein EccB [Streptomyces sp. TLI_171]|uniref:type VII secretion protein EccB n=1 Tax=Streptomyces sp. TLI_171 TaxID=1938859 RepID=UPI000C18C185|nr:type VII secretion protein EccB [Streptomyces sp. TLI_171]RKE21447.1 type VII secretion protein EccB [Streptomyces sp. TLI_171]